MNNTQETLQQHISPLGAWALGVGTSVGWGSLVVTSYTYLVQAGPAGTLLGMTAGALVMLIISRNYAYMMQCYPEAGGAYAYAREVFGCDHGFLAAWFLSLTYLAMLWANATALPLFARFFIGNTFRAVRIYTLFGYEVYLGETLLSLAAIALTALLCARSRRASDILMPVLVLLFSAGICLVFFGAILSHGTVFTPAFLPDTDALSQIVRIAVISPWAFIGFESISHSTAEFSFRRSMIRPLLIVTVLSTLLLYLFVTLLSVTAYPPAYASWIDYIRDLENLSGLEALPAFYAAHHYLGNAGVFALILSLLALILTSLIGNFTALSRLFYALAKDRILPARFSALNSRAVPARAILLTALICAPVPFLGRTAIGWIVDVTTIGATIIYGFVSASACRLARSRGDRAEQQTGALGFAFMLLFALFLLLPNLVSVGAMAKESYFLFIAWSVLGFLLFRRILQRDREQRFGKSVVVWVGLLALVLFISLIWTRQSMLYSNRQMQERIREHYSQTADDSALRPEDESFLRAELRSLEAANTRTILITTGMFVFSLLIMMTNYSFLSRRAQETETIANTDPLTHVKSKHAYLTWEQNLNAAIAENRAGPFAVVVCDVNGLKFINDTLGHKAGDEYILSACRIICEIFDHSPVFRTGGDEFTVILSSRDYEVRKELLEKLHALSEEHIRTGQVVVSAGMSDYLPGMDGSLNAVFERADALMYQEKQLLKSMGARTR